MIKARCLAALAALPLVGGCHMHLFGKSVPECHRPQEYQRAAQVPPLKVPAGLDAPNVQGALLIPALEESPPPPSVKDSCLDEPPRYKAPPPAKAAAG